MQNSENHILDQNISRMLNTSGTTCSPEFENELTSAVLAEVQCERNRIRSRVIRTKWLISGAVAASIALAIILLQEKPASVSVVSSQTVAQVKPVCGLVSLKDGASPQLVKQTEPIHSGQSVRIHSGSRAEIVLNDQSKIFAPPRTVFRIEEDKRGDRVVLQEGSIKVEAAKQLAGRVLAIETPGAQIRVLGTKLDVHLVQKPDGQKQTRVSVASGHVDLESAGRTIHLLPNMEGIADEKQAPVARSLTTEVNELIRLLVKTRDLAEESNIPAGLPTIIDFNDDGSATVWSTVLIENTTNANLTKHNMHRIAADSYAQVFSIEGARLPVMTDDSHWQIDLSSAPIPPGTHGTIFVRITNVRGLFEVKEAGFFEFYSPPSDVQMLSLVQFRLPASSLVESVTPDVLERRETPSRLVITVAGNSPLPNLFE